MGKTQKETASELGLELTTYIKYERGLRQPDMGTSLKIADYFDVSLDYLYKISETSTRKLDRAIEEMASLDEDKLDQVTKYIVFLKNEGESK